MCPPRVDAGRMPRPPLEYLRASAQAGHERIDRAVKRLDVSDPWVVIDPRELDEPGSCNARGKMAAVSHAHPLLIASVSDQRRHTNVWEHVVDVDLGVHAHEAPRHARAR